MIWLHFIICAVVILFSGYHLTTYGDLIAARTNLGRTWIGVILLATITSLPEMMTGIGAVAIYQLPDIAVGNIFGSCVFNLLILAILDALSKNKNCVLSIASPNHLITAGWGFVMILVGGVAMRVGQLPMLGWVDSYSLVLIAMYFVAMQHVYQAEKKIIQEELKEAAAEAKAMSGMKLYGLFAVHAAIIIVASLYLPGIGEEIAKQTGLGNTFVGSVLIAITTSLPEVVVCISALSLGAVDLSLGNLFGSNIFNVGILGLMDLFYTKGSVIQNASKTHFYVIAAGAIMTVIAMVGIKARDRKTVLHLGWDTATLFVIYIGVNFFLYQMR